jgi:ribosomal protein S27E
MSSNEDEYFLKADAEKVKELRAKLDAERASAEKKSHFMKCPKCGNDLKEVTKDHVSIDVCMNCGGVWLDAGELDLLRKVKESRFAGFFNELLSALPGKK